MLWPLFCQSYQVQYNCSYSPITVGNFVTTLPLASISTTNACLPPNRSSDTSSEVWASPSISLDLLTSEVLASAILSRMSATRPTADSLAWIRHRSPTHFTDETTASALLVAAPPPVWPEHGLAPPPTSPMNPPPPP